MSSCSLSRCLALGMLLFQGAGLPHDAVAQHPPLEQLERYGIADLWNSVDGRTERVEADGEAVLRWHLEPGQKAELAMKPEHAVFSRLRYYDRLELEFRIVSGQVDSLDLQAQGHVSGPRQYKVHQWSLAILTTRPEVWHARQLDLARPNWFPWDNPDGGSSHFTFGALAVEPGTVVELRRLRLARSAIVVKPFFESPITWPIRSQAADDSVTYTLQIPVLNTSGKPTTIAGNLVSGHERFEVTIEPSEQRVNNGAKAEFTVKARISKGDIDATHELFTETLRVAFAAQSEPQNVVTFEMSLVRPLSPGLKRQFVISETDLTFLRERLRENDPALKDLKVESIVAEADKFLNIDLDQIPRGYGHPSNRWPTVPESKPPRPFEIGSVMPAVVNPITGAREIGTPLSDETWKEYLGYSGKITEKLGLAYAFTGDEKYAAKAVELMERYASQYEHLKWNSLFEPSWSNGPAILSSSRIAGNSTYGSNRLFRWHMRMLGLIGNSPSLTPEARNRIYEGFVLPYATELAKFPGGISNMTDISNHNLLVLGLVFDDAHLVHWALNTDAGLASRVRDIDGDGFSSEGRPLNYHRAAMEEYLPSLAYVWNSGLGLDNVKKQLLAAIRMPYERATLWGVVPNTGDCGRGVRVGNTALADQLISLFPEETWLLDIGLDTTIASKLRRLKAGRPLQKEGYKQFLETTPRLYREAGLAILRSGDTQETQIMATLDYGRNPMHGHLDRNQITLSAFGKVFTHGPGSSYNVGSGGITRNNDPRLNSFCGPGSLGQNIVLVDGKNQRPAIGKLLAWSANSATQYATAQVSGVAPGVSHTRTLILRHGLVIAIDQLESAGEHQYDFVYHNFGVLSPESGWQENPVEKVLGEEANYSKIVDPKRLVGVGPVHLEWDLSAEIPPAKTHPADRIVQNGVPELPAKTGLALWQLPLPDGEVYTGITGMNNPNTGKTPDAAPSLIARARGKAVYFVTVLEPFKDSPKITGIDGDFKKLTIHLGATERITIRQEDWIQTEQHAQ